MWKKLGKEGSERGIEEIRVEFLTSPPEAQSWSFQRHILLLRWDSHRETESLWKLLPLSLVDLGLLLPTGPTAGKRSWMQSGERGSSWNPPAPQCLPISTSNQTPLHLPVSFIFPFWSTLIWNHIRKEILEYIISF